MKVSKESMLLYIVTDRTWLGENSLADQVEDAIQSGATFVQLREKELDFESFVAEAQKIKVITDKYKIPFVINDNIEVALAVGADGVHVGQSDLNAKDCRKLIGDGKILGVSAQTVEQALNAEKNGADYIGVGAVFSTSTKKDADSVSFETLKSICNAVKIPVVAIGGISKENILNLSGSGIDGVAVISAIFAEKNIKKATAELLQLSKSVCEKKKAFIFDLDGTLLDSMSIWDNIGEDYLKTRGITNIPENLLEMLKNKSLLGAAEFFMSEFSINKTPQEIYDEICLLVEGKYTYDVTLKRGVKEFLEKHKEKAMCIATATDTRLAEIAMTRLGIWGYFQFVLTSKDVGNSKQEPDIYLISAQKLGVEIGECVVFEDAFHALKTAKTAGFYTVGVFDESCNYSRNEILEYSDQFVENLMEAEL